MKKVLGLISILFPLISCFSCSSLTTKESSKEKESSSIRIPEHTYKNVVYNNPLHFYKQDGSEYFVGVADPDIYRDNQSGYFYMYCTNTYCEMGKSGMQYDRGPIFRSENLVDWTWCGSVFQNNPSALNWHDKEAGVWAPSLIKVGGLYNYYYSLSLWGDDNPGIGVATSPTPYGPWTHYGKVLDVNLSGVKNGIDPQPFYDGDDLYLIWGSFFGIAATKLTDDGLEPFYGEYTKDNLFWLVSDNTTGKMNININYEGSYVIRHNNKVYYFGSQGSCCSGASSTYNVRAGVANNFLEPFTTHDGTLLSDDPYGEVVIAPSEDVTGVGHNTVVTDFAGDYWLFYHGYDIHGEFPDERIVFMDKLLWDENDMPYVENKKASYHENILGPTIVNFDK